MSAAIDMKPKLTTIAQLAVILATALALKYHYSTASVNDLRWILAPTTFLVETITGSRFTFESYAGYMSEDRTFLIAASCSGVNFLIVAFVMLSVGRFWKERQIKWSFMVISFLTAFSVTIVANTARIVTALTVRRNELRVDWLGADDLHRVEGVTVYFSFLLLLFVASEKLSTRRATSAWHLGLPLVTYYSATLGVPLAGGSHQDPVFWNHAAFVLLIPPMLMLPLLLPALRSGDMFRSRKTDGDKTSLLSLS
jgi:exosortase K